MGDEAVQEDRRATVREILEEVRTLNLPRLDESVAMIREDRDSLLRQ